MVDLESLGELVVWTFWHVAAYSISLHPVQGGLLKDSFQRRRENAQARATV